MDLLFIGLLTVVGSAVGTLSGFGTSTIMVPVLLFFFPLGQALLLVGILHWFGDIWKIALFREGLRFRFVLLFGVPGIVCSFLGALLSVAGHQQQMLLRLLGGLLIAYVVFLLAKPTFTLPANRSVAATGGALSGFLAGLFGIGGAVRGAFLAAFDLPKAVYISTAGSIALLVDTSRLLTYYLGGTRLAPDLVWGLLLFVPASFFGAQLAKKVVHRIPQRQFRLAIAFFLFLIGLKLLFRP